MANEEQSSDSAIDASAQAIDGTQVISREGRDHAGTPEPIAVIGLGCRFPGATDSDAFWQLLHDRIDPITEVPPDRWPVDDYYDQRTGTRGRMNTRWGGFLDQVDMFDPKFFGISPREAARMDPQQRLLLEVTWEALENAGLTADKRAHTQTGVFVGISNFDYNQIQFLYNDPAQFIDAYSGTGVAHSVAANRISYLLNLHGPSIATDTACSSSLVAIHLACQSLRSGESDVALAGGVNVILNPEVTVGFSLARMLAADGRCKAFDASADGYVRSEGCGMVVLKRLSDALSDCDLIIGLLRGSAVNQDGRTNGLTSPNGQAQQAVIRRALAQAAVSANQIGCLEAQGTGTALGDAIEFKAIREVFAGRDASSPPCVVGAVKANIGHLEAASGIASVIKVLLCLEHGEIPAQMHLKSLNPQIQLENSSLIIPTERYSWPRGNAPRFAGVNCFGFGGTNAHLVIEEAPARRPPEPQIDRPLHLLTLSAKSETALRELARRFERYSASAENSKLADICYSANTGRSRFAHRLAVSAASKDQLGARLAAFASLQEAPGLYHKHARKQRLPQMAFLFSDKIANGDLCQELYRTQPTFRRSFDACAKALDARLDQPLSSVLSAETDSVLRKETFTQPALFALEYALAELWLSWGIKPDVLLGHDVGEYVAACQAGAFNLEEGLKLVSERARLMQTLRGPAHTAVISADETLVSAILTPYKEQVSITALNEPSETVISGLSKSVQAVLKELQSAGVTGRVLPSADIAHSVLVEPMLDEFEQVLGQVSFRALSLPVVSSHTGKVLKKGFVPDASYWRRHTRESVRFAQGIRTLSEQGCEIFLEIGTDRRLLKMGQECLPEGSGLWLSSLHKGQSAWEVMLQSLAQLFIHGLEGNGAAFDGDYQRRRLALPTYPFERQRCWLEPDPTKLRGNKRVPRAGASFPDPQTLADRHDNVEEGNRPTVEMPRSPGRCLILTDDAGLGKEVAALLAYRKIALAHGNQSSFTPEQRLETLEQTFVQGAAPVSVVFVDGRWGEISSRIDELLHSEPAREGGGKQVETNDYDQRQSIRAAWFAADVSERELLLRDFLQRVLGSVLALKQIPLHSDATFETLGLDSLMILELQDHIEKSLGIALSMDFLQSPSIAALASKLSEALTESLPAAGAAQDRGMEAGAERTQAWNAVEAKQLLSRLDQISDEEVNRLLDDILS